MKRSFFTLLLAVLILAVAAGPVLRTQAHVAADPVTVHVLTMDQAAMSTDEMESVVKDFEATNPNIKVDLEFIAYDNLHDKFVTAMATNPPPYDIVIVDVIWYDEFIKAGYIADVTDMVNSEMKDTKDKIFPTAWNVVTRDGKHYGMPWLLDTKYFYYNTDILKQAGFDKPPATWEEMLTQAKAIKDKGLVEYPIVWSWAQAEAAICDFTALLYGNGGTFLDKDGKPAINDAKGVATLEWMVKTIDDGLTNPASISDLEEDVRNIFSSGKAAFAVNWLYMYDKANFDEKESTITGKVGITTIPVFASAGIKDTTASVDGSMGFSIVSNSANKEAAFAYLKYLTSEPVQIKYSAKQLPIWQTSFEGDALKTLLGSTKTAPITVPMFKSQFSFAHVRPTVPYYLEGSKALQLALQQALTKQKTAKEALDAAAATWTELAAKK